MIILKDLALFMQSSCAGLYHVSCMHVSIKTKSEYEAVAVLAQDREQWREVVQNVAQKYCESRKEKVTK